MTTRDCGCVYEVLPLTELSESQLARWRARWRGSSVYSPTFIRFAKRCDRHAPMCRSLEAWEIDAHVTAENPDPNLT